MKRFKTIHYTIHSNKIKDARGIRFAVLADLHGMEFGPDNRKLLETIHRYRPDGILIAGDMIVRNDSASLKTASSLLRSHAQQYPVYYALGNHEYKLYRTDPQENCMAARYQEYEKELKTAGIHILHNESCSLQVGKHPIVPANSYNPSMIMPAQDQICPPVKIGFSIFGTVGPKNIQGIGRWFSDQFPDFLSPKLWRKWLLIIDQRYFQAIDSKTGFSHLQAAGFIIMEGL